MPTNAAGSYVIGATGHRAPERMCYAWYDTGLLEVADIFMAANNHAISYAHLGGAPGWDTAMALVCLKFSVPYTLHVPVQHQSIIPHADRPLYKACRDAAREVIEYGTEPDRAALFARNAGIIDSSDIVVAMWDNKRKGGTNHAINYAHVSGKEVYNLYFELRRRRPPYGKRAGRQSFTPRPGL